MPDIVLNLGTLTVNKITRSLSSSIIHSKRGTENKTSKPISSFSKCNEGFNGLRYRIWERGNFP